MVKVPRPVLVNPAAPLMTPLIVWFMAALSIWKTPPPPARVNAFELLADVVAVSSSVPTEFSVSAVVALQFKSGLAEMVT